MADELGRALMPTFRSQPSSDLASSIRRAVASRGLNNPEQINMVADQAAATTAQHMGLAEKARAEAEAIRNAETARSDPKVSQEFASRSAGLTDAEGGRLMGHLRGAVEQPTSNDDLDASMRGNEAQPFTMEPPNIKPGQRRGFESALASTIANRIATGHTNAEQLAKSGQDINKTAVQNAATDTTDVPAANQLLTAINAKAREPFKMTAQGALLNEESGALNEDTATGRAWRAAQDKKNDPGAKGWTMYKDKENNLLRFNPNAGLVEKKLPNGSWVQSDEIPEGLTKLGMMAGGGAMNQRFSGRVIGAANEGFAAINSIAKLSDPQSGLFSSKAMSGADGKSVLAGAFTPEKVKRYNATLAGLAVEIATAQNQGMLPHEEQIKAVREAITIGPTDDDVTKRYRVALAARYIRKGLEVSMDLANPDQKKRAQGILKDLEKIPDPDTIETENKGAGLFPGGAAPVATNAKGWKLMTDAKGNKAYVSPDGKEFEEAK